MKKIVLNIVVVTIFVGATAVPSFATGPTDPRGNNVSTTQNGASVAIQTALAWLSVLL